MTHRDCHAFRERLLEALEGKPRPAEIRTLSWHEHLLACGDCRGLLEREEALEVLLATLPQPKLPPELVKRLVLRLGPRWDEPQRGVSLDTLLELDAHGETAPRGLADRTRAGVARERALEEILDRWPEPQAPAGLSARVLAGLSEARGQRSPRPRLSSRLSRYAAAAALLLGLLSAPWWMDRAGSPQAPQAGDAGLETPVVTRDAEPVDSSLLEMLDVLENDRLWAETEGGARILIEEVDLHLFLEAQVDEGDEVLLAFLPPDSDAQEEPSDG